jgi:subtilisin family serine protease
VTEIRATQAKQQYNLSGKGVIVGIIDTGIDWRHQDFRNADGTTRIKALLDLSEKGNDISEGTLYTEQEINNALNGTGTLNEKDLVGHGTHVAGSAAGSGRATGNGVPAGTYVGVAHEADLVIVKANSPGEDGTTFNRNNYIPSMEFIRDFAKSVNKPFIINISSGGNFGPHDGTDPVEEAIDFLLTETNSKCKAVVVSAGNDADDNIHASGTFGSGITSIETKFSVPSYTPNADKLNDVVQFEGWYKGTLNYTVKVTTPTGIVSTTVSSGNDWGNDTADGAISISNAKYGKSDNGDKQILISIFDNNSARPPKQGIWKITIYGSTGRFDLWMAGTSMNAELTSNVDYSMIVGTPGTAEKAMTVGSYITKRNWTDLNGNNLQSPNLTIGGISSFSSPGPTRDGRTKPEISAPGELIAAAYSADAPPTGQFSIFSSSYSQWPNAYITRDGKHALTQGTSFAAPHVAGAIALMVQQYPTKTPTEIRQSLIATARTDNFTGAVPNNMWGYGKLDVMAALQLLPVDETGDESFVPETMELRQNYPNPFNPSTTIVYFVNERTEVQISVINILGQKIRNLFIGNQNPGSYKIIWDGKDELGKDVSSGIYFYRLDAGKFSQTRKMILLL